MRQWDSSLKHNGMSFFAATIPDKTLLYHGTHTHKAVEGTEWLAFEIEHAENFARTRGRGPGGRRPPPPGEGGPPGDGDGDGDSRGPPGEYGPPPTKRHANGILAEGNGYLHIYQTKKTLSNLLFLDGMSAGKTSMGTLDTQDRVLCNLSSEAPGNGRGGAMGDYQRATQMCAFPGIDGIVRMEAGFEVILCNFSSGVELISAFQRPTGEGAETYDLVQQFEYMRGIAARYEGITAGRVTVDYSSMVSGFFYPLNLTNPDVEKRELPRLPLEDKEGLLRLKRDVVDLFAPGGGAENQKSVDWQGVTDMVVSRYAERLQYLVANTTIQKRMLSEVNFLLSLFIDYKDTPINSGASIAQCTTHYLRPITPVTEADHLIHASISTVSERICSTLFTARAKLLEDGINGETVADEVRKEIKSLIAYLNWSTWLGCGKCEFDEVCFVAIWPWGGLEDHYKPGCVKENAIGSRRGYWGGFGGRSVGEDEGMRL